MFLESLKYTVRLWFWGRICLHPLSCFAAFLYLSCSVAVSYFMLIPVFAFFFISVTVFNLRIFVNGIKFLWQDLDACN